MALPSGVKAAIETGIRERFDAYFTFTKSLTRSILQPQGHFIYPNESMLSDLTVLSSLFAEVYQAFEEHGGKVPGFVTYVLSELPLLVDLGRILEGHDAQEQDGSYWDFSVTSAGPIPRADVLSAGHLDSLLRTLRNGFQHFHWRFENLSALDYWKARQWSTLGAPAAFNLSGRPPKNYMAYIADAYRLDPQNFWQHKDLRILVTPHHVLRYHLYLFLHYLTYGRRLDIFGIPA